MGNAEKSATLGMPHGTANGRLRKMILFSLLSRHKENVCHVCKRLIDSVDELSIEHKKPWEGISAELFWDLENIAFSHMFCNRPHRNTGGADTQRFKGPEGTSWCVGHKRFEPIENFWKNATRWTGLEQYCKETKPRNR